jgi:hypothetical protein
LMKAKETEMMSGMKIYFFEKKLMWWWHYHGHC